MVWGINLSCLFNYSRHNFLSTAYGEDLKRPSQETTETHTPSSDVVRVYLITDSESMHNGSSHIALEIAYWHSSLGVDDEKLMMDIEVACYCNMPISYTLPD